MAAVFSVLLVLAAISGAFAEESLVAELRNNGLTGFSHLVAAADLSNIIQMAAKIHGSVTILAPSDHALMTHVSPSMMAYLKHEANREVLRTVLLNHVIPGRVSAFRWAGARTSLSGESLDLKMDALAFHVSNVAVEQYNALVTDTGLTVHAIAGVLLPKAVEQQIAEVARSGEVRLLTSTPMPYAMAPTPMMGPTMPPMMMPPMKKERVVPRRHLTVEPKKEKKGLSFLSAVFARLF